MSTTEQSSNNLSYEGNLEKYIQTVTKISPLLFYKVKV